jgi:hypothetical protein
MKVNRINANAIKAEYPNFFAKQTGYYNFCHEIRNTQKHLYFQLIMYFCAAYCYNAFKGTAVTASLEKVDTVISNLNKRIANINGDAKLTNDTKEKLLGINERLLLQANEAKEFINKFGWY